MEVTPCSWFKAKYMTYCSLMPFNWHHNKHRTETLSNMDFPHSNGQYLMLFVAFAIEGTIVSKYVWYMALSLYHQTFVVDDIFF